ncbi:MAG: SGNH/GDSL hydrolase family protein [Pseudolabrys sp.]|nr:SGNH/GDSL hydrolase family protein [Pseudolabrys sp.]MDP2294838.1 SGNH/GDSL hydrolase family protein [Pseudolabrys sp.]
MDLASRALHRLAALFVFVLLALPLSAHAEPQGTPPCNPPQDLVRLSTPLKQVARKLANGDPITIVALGSSSTAGAGASSSTASYPSQLAAELQRRFPKQSITMINRGVNGEEVPDMLKRFDTAVVASKPDLLLWQLGTNSLIRDHAMENRGASIREGLDKVRAIGADVVLIDPQFAPKVIAKPQAGQMVDFIAATAQKENVGLFRRFAAMQRWTEVDHLPFSSFLIADGLHLNDWGYYCMAKGLALAIADAATRPVMAAGATARPMMSSLPVVAAKVTAPAPH